MSSKTLLPLYHQQSEAKESGGFKIKETHLLFILIITFLFAWGGLISYLPEVEHTDASFHDAYRKFTHRTPLSQRMGTSDEPVGSHKQMEEDLNSIGDSKSLDDGLESDDNTDEKIDEVRNHEEDGQSNEEDGQSNEERDAEYENDINDYIRDKVGGADVEKREKVKEMIKLAWDGYVRYAMGENELKPIAKRGHSAAVFGKTHLGATIVDSLDTLYIAGLHDEFNQGKDWVENHFKIESIQTDISVFEFTIRFTGGFLAAYALSGDEVFKRKAIEVADRLMPAFNTPTGYPKSLFNLNTGDSKNWKWASGGSCILSEIGTLHLEYQYLTAITSDPKYFNKVSHIRTKLRSTSRPDGGLYPNYVNPSTGAWGQKHYSLGALGDSFYEYLIKSWLITSKHDEEGRDMFYEVLPAVESRMIKVVGNQFHMMTDVRNGRSDNKMQHLACFSGGMYGLASEHATDDKKKHYLEIARGLTAACHESYDQPASKLGPEAFRMDSNGKVSSSSNEKVYLLRPETVESYFYLWRLTHDPIYRQWGWEAVQALETHCRTENGYSGVKDVYSDHPAKDDVQQSFFIAETLKYLYLLFSDDDDISLDKWVFNTEAHPLPVLDNIPVHT